MRVLGLDVGEKKIGVAISDELGLAAHGIAVIDRGNNFKEVDKISEIVSKYMVRKIVVGLPKNMNGSMGLSGEAVKDYAKNLKKTLNIEIVFWDERLTTVAAERTLLKADISRKKRKKVVDKLAAILILQGYLDFKSKTT